MRPSSCGNRWDGRSCSRASTNYHRIAWPPVARTSEPPGDPALIPGRRLRSWLLETVGAALAFEVLFALLTQLLMNDRSGRYGGPLTVGTPGSVGFLSSAATFEPLPFAFDTLATALVLGLLRVSAGRVGFGMGALGATIYLIAALLAHVAQGLPPLVPPLLDHRVPGFTSLASLPLVWANTMIVAVLFGAGSSLAIGLMRRVATPEHKTDRG